jgi:hypothetical protein
MTDIDRNPVLEIVGWFVLGLLICIPIFFVLRRLKTRKNELASTKKSSSSLGFRPMKD